MNENSEGNGRVFPTIDCLARCVRYCETNQWKIVAEDTMEDSLRNINPEDGEVKVLSAVTSFKEDRVSKAHFSINILIKDKCEHARPTGP